MVQRLAVAMKTEGNDVKRRFRKRGHPTEKVQFRCPKELVEAMDKEGEDRTDGLVAMLDRANDTKLEAGDEAWLFVMVRAYKEGITEGQAIGRYLQEAVDRERKGGKR